MRVANESELCTVYHQSEVTVNDVVEDNRPSSARVAAFEFSLEGKSIQLEPRVREDPRQKATVQKVSSTSPQQLRIDLQREQGIRIPTKNKSSTRVRRSKAQQRRQSEQRKSVKEVPECRRPFLASRNLIQPRTPLVMSKMSLPTEGQKFSDNGNAVVINTAEEASNVVKRILGTNSVVEEATTTKKVTKQMAIKGNVNTAQSLVGQELTEAIQQQGTQAIRDAASSINAQSLQQSSRDDTNNNTSLAEINSSNQSVNTSQQTTSKKTTTSSSSTVSTKSTRRESYSTQTHVKESFSSSYEDVEDNSGVQQAICSPEQVKQSATNVNQSSKTTKQTEIRQSTLQSTSSIDSDISSVDAENVRKVKQDTQKANQQSTAVQQNISEKQNVTDQSQIVQQKVNTSTQNTETQQQIQQKRDTEKITSENTDYSENTKTMTMEEFQKIRKIKEYITIQRKLRNAEDGDTEEEEEESHEAEKIMSVDEVRKRLATKPPKEIINDNTKNETIVKGSRIAEVRTVTKTIYPNPDNADEEIEQETVVIDRKVVPAGSTILTSDENTETTQKQVVTAQESTVKKTTTESQKVQQTKSQVTDSQSNTGTQNTNVQSVQTNQQNVQQLQTNQQNVQQLQTAKDVQQLETAKNVQELQTAKNIQEVQTAKNVQQVQTAKDVQEVQTTQNVQQVNSSTQNVQKIQETQNVQRNAQETQNVQKSVQDSQNVQSQQLVQNEALKKTSVNTVKQTQRTVLSSTSSIDSDTSSLDEASRLISNSQFDNQNRQLVDTNQSNVGGSTVTQTSSKTTKVTESRKIIKQSSSAAPETFVEESSQQHTAEKVVNAVCGADGKFNVQENTKSSTTISSGVGDQEEMKRQIKTQSKELTKKLVSDGQVVVADVDQFREKIVREEEGSRDQPTVTFSKTTSDSKHKHMEEEASKFSQPALPSPDSGSVSPMSPIDFPPALQAAPNK